ncbi:MAG: hypothetical protein QOG62_719 [Thermoleophilaceae bacterium]|jgi:hypothetical protein|nr:hypothetical protein [Thermoleophilaceae bacterium]
MEAAQTLRFPSSTVVLTPDGVLIDGLVVGDAKLAELVQARIDLGESPEQAVIDALEIGARVLDRESTAAEVDFVRREVEKMSEDAQRSIGERTEKVAEVVDQKLDELFGEEGVISQVLGQRAEAMTAELQKHFSDESSGAVQNRVKQVLTEGLAQSRTDLVKLFNAGDGSNPLADFKEAVSNRIKEGNEANVKLAEKIGSLEVAIGKLGAETEAAAELHAERERGTGKGRAFEALVFDEIERLAAARDDSAEHTGDGLSESGDKVGDAVVELDACNGPSKGRIVFEMKDKQLSKPQAWRELDAALETRDAAFAILVVSAEEKIPAGLHPLSEYQGNKMIVTLDKEDLDVRGLALAYRYARVRILGQNDAATEVDAAGVRAATEEASAALKDAQKIRLHLTKASDGVGEARAVLDGMVERASGSLARIEAILAAGGE